MCIVEYVTDCSLDKANSSVVSGGGCPGPPQTEQTMMSPINSPRMVVCFYGLYLFWKIGSQAARQPLSFDSYLQNSKTETISQSLRQSSSDFPPRECKVECDLSLGQPEKKQQEFLSHCLISSCCQQTNYHPPPIDFLYLACCAVQSPWQCIHHFHHSAFPVSASTHSLRPFN